MGSGSDPLELHKTGYRRMWQVLLKAPAATQ